jgi:hypothetical protein
VDNSGTLLLQFDTVLGMVITTRALGAVLLMPLVLGGIVGCSAQQGEESIPPSTASSSPSNMVSEQEALDAAQKAYSEYLAMSDLIAQEGGLNPERLQPFVTEQQFRNELEGIANYSSKNLHLAGGSSFDSVHIANPDLQHFGIYLCIDNSKARIFDSVETDVTPEGRVDRWPLIVSFTQQSESLIVSGSETWTGSNFC